MYSSSRQNRARGGGTDGDRGHRSRSARRQDRSSDRGAQPDKARGRSKSGRKKGRQRSPRADDEGGLPPGGAAWPYGGYGGVSAGYPANANAYWDYAQRVSRGAEDGERKKKKKKKKKRGDSSSSSSSSSSSADDAMAQWHNMWRNWQQQQQGMAWPHPPPGGPPMPWGPYPGHWPPPGPGGHPPPSFPPEQPQLEQGGWGGADEEEEERAPPKGDVPIFLEPSVEELVPVPKALLGKVIGKQAQTIIEIREKSGAFKVDARDQTSDPCMVKVAGTAEAVKKAKALIMDMLENTKSKHSGSDYVEIPRSKIGMVIGLKGSQVNEIQGQTNTKIDVEFDSDPCKCFIKGDPENVDRAKKVLLTIAMQIEDDSSEYLELPKTVSGALIGAQGSRVRDFQEQSGARIDIDKSGSTCKVRITGNKEAIAIAKHLILNEVEKATTPARRQPMLAPQAVVVPSHQPSSFPATLSESIARAKAAAEAVKHGLITGPPALTPSLGAGVVPPPPPPSGGPAQWGW